MNEGTNITLVSKDICIEVSEQKVLRDLFKFDVNLYMVELKIEFKT